MKMAVGAIRESPLRGLAGAWIPAYVEMTGGDAVSGTGNHKGCPYDGLAEGYFRLQSPLISNRVLRGISTSQHPAQTLGHEDRLLVRHAVGDHGVGAVHFSYPDSGAAGIEFGADVVRGLADD